MKLFDGFYPEDFVGKEICVAWFRPSLAFVARAVQSARVKSDQRRLDTLRGVLNGNLIPGSFDAVYSVPDCIDRLASAAGLDENSPVEEWSRFLRMQYGNVLSKENTSLYAPCPKPYRGTVHVTSEH